MSDHILAGNALADAERSIMRGHYKVMIRRGFLAAAVLAVLSVLEYVVAQEMTHPTWFLVPFMFGKGAIILDAFMHIRSLRGEGGH